MFYYFYSYFRKSLRLLQKLSTTTWPPVGKHCQRFCNFSSSTPLPHPERSENFLVLVCLIVYTLLKTAPVSTSSTMGKRTLFKIILKWEIKEQKIEFNAKRVFYFLLNYKIRNVQSHAHIHSHTHIWWTTRHNTGLELDMSYNKCWHQKRITVETGSGKRREWFCYRTIYSDSYEEWDSTLSSAHMA